MTLKNRVALVTGGAVRIGAAIVRALARRGAGVVVHYRSSGAAARALVREVRAGGGEAWAVRAALDTEAGCAALIRAAARRAGRIDLLVNNAAVFHKDRLADLTGTRLLAELRPNLFAPLFLIKHFAAAANGGRIVNLLDRRVATHDPSCLPYLLSKKALEAATRTLALELAPRFTVNAVAPGPVLPPPGKPASYLRDRAGPVPLQRRVPPEDVAEAVAWLLERDTVTGQVLFVDGGQHLLGGVG